ncbi:MAG: conjugal transfer protein TraF, partial [Armatimonadota bacterium]
GLSLSWAQQQLTLGDNAQRARAGLTNVLGIRAAGMGGTAIAAPESGTALYWNPAALASQRGFRIYGSIGGSAEGLDAAEDLMDVVEIIEDAEVNQTIALGDYFTIRDIVRRNSGEAIRGELGLLGSVEFSNFAIGYWAIGGGDAGVTYTRNGTEEVDWNAGAVGQGGAGVAYGTNLSSRLDVGVTARMALAGIAEAAGEAQATLDANDIPTDAEYTEDDQYSENDDDFTVDIGLLYACSDQSKIGLVGRNLTEPSFDLPNSPFDKLEASVDLGYAWTSDEGEIFAIDIHNLTEANDSASSVSAGINKPLTDWLDFRFGYGHNEPTVGIGLDIGALQLDVASALTWEDRVGVAGSVSF